jgi:hypothetical protein
LPRPTGPKETGNLKFTIYVLLVPKNLKKNWCSGYQEEVKKMFKCLAPPWWQNLYPEDNKIHKFSRGLPALHHHAFSFSYIHVVSEKISFLKKWSILALFALPHRPKGGKKPEIHNLSCPCPKDAS